MSRIAAIRAAAAGAPAPVIDDEDDIETNPAETEKSGKPSKKKDKDMSDEQNAQAISDARKEAAAEATKAANDRFATVMASEDYAGREALAKTLLATDLSAEQIVTSLASAPKPGATALDTEAAREAAEEAGRKEMQAALAKGANSNIDANPDGGGKPDAKAAADALWDRTYAALDAQRPK